MPPMKESSFRVRIVLGEIVYLDTQDYPLAPLHYSVATNLRIQLRSY